MLSEESRTIGGGAEAPRNAEKRMMLYWGGGWERTHAWAEIGFDDRRECNHPKTNRSRRGECGADAPRTAREAEEADREAELKHRATPKRLTLCWGGDGGRAWDVRRVLGAAEMQLFGDKALPLRGMRR